MKTIKGPLFKFFYFLKEKESEQDEERNSFKQIISPSKEEHPFEEKKKDENISLNKENNHFANDSHMRILHEEEKKIEIEIEDEEDQNQQYFMNMSNEDLGLLARQDSNHQNKELEIIIDYKKPEIKPFEPEEKISQANPTIMIGDDEKNLLLNQNLEPAKDEIEVAKNEDKKEECFLNLPSSPQNDLNSSPFFSLSPNNQIASNSMFSPISQNGPTLPPTPANAGKNATMNASYTKNLVAKIKQSKFKYRKEEKFEKVLHISFFLFYILKR